MCAASRWVTLIALFIGISSVFVIDRSEQATFSPSVGQIVKPAPGVIVKPAPGVIVGRPPVPDRLGAVTVAQAQAAAVPLGDIPSAPVGKVNFNGDPRNPVWKVEGKWETTSEDARRAAQLQAQEELVAYLRSQEPPLKWVPPLSFIGDRHKKLVTRSEEETHDFPEIGTMRRFVLEMNLPTEARREIWRHEREAHARERMLFLAKILAGLVSVLAATAGYLRLDELTKGYYSGWLRLGAAGLLGVTAVALALLA